MSLTPAVMLAPSRHQNAWRHALTETAQAAGLTVFSHYGEAVEHLSPSILIISVDPRPLLAIPGLAWTAIFGAPDDTISASWRADEDWHSAMLQASNRLGIVSTLIAQGAASVAADANSAMIPGLGLVTRSLPAAQGETRAPADYADLLAVYQAIPTPANATAAWPPRHFRLPLSNSPGGVIDTFDLTGRARIVFNGPGIELPAGVWQAEVSLAVDTEGVSTVLRLDWGLDGASAEFPFTFKTPGVYKISVETDFPAAGHAILRLATPQGLFQGRLTLLDCIISRA